MRNLVSAGAIALSIAVCYASSIIAAEEPRPASYLTNGRLAEGEKQLQQRLSRLSDDDSLRFALGAAQFLGSLEHLGQDLHCYGLRDQNWFFLPALRLPFGKNPKPERLTYDKSRAIVQAWVSGLERAQATLAAIKDPNVALPVQVDQIKLNISSDAATPMIVPLMDVMSRVGLAPANGQAGAVTLLIRFDRADVAWLRGYCHLLSALGEIVLAHDERELFNATAHLFFSRVETPFTFLKDPQSDGQFGGLTDLIAMVHLMRLPVNEPVRMKRALDHLEQMIGQSREMWKFALAETDNDHEWIPNPKQKGPFNSTISQEMVAGWMTFLDEAEGLLQGRLRIPFWRASPQGVSLRRVFSEPRTFDLVLWIQGTAAVPYLEDGPKTSFGTWERLARIFQGDFVRFFVWIN